MRSDLSARMSNSFWKSVSFFSHSPGSFWDSAISCKPQYIQSSPLFSMSRDIPLNVDIVSRPWSATHCASFIQSAKSSGSGGGFGPFTPLSRALYSKESSSPAWSRMENVSRVDTINLSLSNRPRRVKLNTVYVVVSSNAFRRISISSSVGSGVASAAPLPSAADFFFEGISVASRSMFQSNLPITRLATVLKLILTFLFRPPGAMSIPRLNTVTNALSEKA
mmetsp:Transcript_134735/g.327507  ORF Transcript_134735/g.327507 Transcript_134735/m.327507 type:complete len:222 (+) Transcript_134735:689-1354(+)